jgi:hypothetical protein
VVLVVGANSANGNGQETGDFISKQTFAATEGTACSYSLSATEQAFAAAGGTGNVTVTTGSGCAWTAASNAAFITITSGASGSGNGAVGFSVAANSGAARSGTVTVAGQTFTVTQAAAASCSVSLSPTSEPFASAGRTVVVNVTAASSCSWTATPSDAFITIVGANSGTGNGTVTLAVAANGGAGSRTGAVTIGGQTFSAIQAGAVAEPEKSNFAQFANGDLGGGQKFTSSLVVINRSSTQNATGTVRIFDSNGNPVSANISSAAGSEPAPTAAKGAVKTGAAILGGIFPFEVPPLGIRIYSTDGAGSIVVGSVQLSSTIPVSSVIIFASPSGTAGVGAVQPLTRFSVPIQSNTALGIDTGVAVSNSSASLVDVTYTLRDSNGLPVSGASVVKSIAPNGQLAQFPSQLFAGKGIDFSRFTGTIEVNSPVPVNGMAILTTPGQFSTLPVAPLN